MRAKKRPVFGVGVNDSTEEVHFLSSEGKKVMCPYYQTWAAMLRRCYSSKSHQERPNYLHCTVSPVWHSFTAFRDWMQQQVWQGMHLDKDLLVPGNTCYSPETCVFVSPQVNAFLLSRERDRGPWPIGVVKISNSASFMARISIEGKNKHLGSFPTPEQAHQAWRAAKHQQALVLAAQQTDVRVAQALATRFI